MAVNNLIATNLAAIATFENERRKDRQRQGIKAAKAAGKYIGRKTVINKKLIDEVKGRARTTIYKILKEELNYIPYNRLVKGD